MKRFVALFAAALVGVTLPVTTAQAQGRGSAECPQGRAGIACRDISRDLPQARSGGPRERPDRERPRLNSLGEGWAPRGDDAREGVRGGRLVPLEQVIRNIARQTPGRLLDAGLEGGGDRPVYRVRWQTNDGRRIDYIVDARSGSIIGRN